MSRVSIKTRDDLPAELRPLWDKMTTYGAFENQAGVMAHRPPIFKHTWSLLVDLAETAPCRSAIWSSRWSRCRC